MFVVLAAGLYAGTASADTIAVDQRVFQANASLINFNEVPLNTIDPVYRPPAAAGPSAAIVRFGGYFQGQSQASAAACHGAGTACVAGAPSAALALDPNAPPTITTFDASLSGTDPVLAGSPVFAGPISVVFSVDQAAVGVTAGFFDVVGANAFTAFDRDGRLLGSITNDALGYTFLGLGSENGDNEIAGVQLDGLAADAAGFAIDSLLFGRTDQIDVDLLPESPQPQPPAMTPVPEPGVFGVFLLAAALIGGGLTARGRASRTPG